jgi:hypothetical protein
MVKREVRLVAKPSTLSEDNLPVPERPLRENHPEPGIAEGTVF